MSFKIHNSLTKKIEVFSPMKTGEVKMYTCGPTVYDYPSIGNYRTFFLSDLIHRTLLFQGNSVDFIMNLTDVGHLTGDNKGNASEGEDRLEKAASKEGKSAREIADFYIKSFFSDYEKLNYLKPRKFTKATDYIQEQIALVRTLERTGFTYRITDGIYFDTQKFQKYGALTGLSDASFSEGARIEPNPEKKHPMDFALWKLSPTNEKRWQEWESPWGVGFPGWHIECSAMIMAELGNHIDIHVGGEDLKLHHQNEIAQAECATGETFCNYWVHGAFLQVDGGRMGKSLNNAYTISDIEDRGFDPLSLRYFYMTAIYDGPINFSWASLQAAQNAYKKLCDVLSGYKENPDAHVNKNFISQFEDAIYDNLNMPKALAVVWEIIKSDIAEEDKVATILKIDEVLGLKLVNYIGFDVPKTILDLVKTRNEYRKSGIFDKADLIRRQILDLGYTVEDLDDGRFRIKRRS